MESAGGAHAYTVLVVDDDPDVREAVAGLLGRLPRVRVVTCASGAEAVATLERQPVHAVLTDQRMPGMSGMQVLRRARGLRPAAPRIMMTAYADVQLAVEAVNRGRVSYFLLKPVDPQELLRTVAAALEQARVHALQAEALNEADLLVSEWWKEARGQAPPQRLPEGLWQRREECR